MRNGPSRPSSPAASGGARKATNSSGTPASGQKRKAVPTYSRFYFGKYLGKRIDQAPPSYLAWCLRTLTDLQPYFRREIRECLEESGRKPPPE